MIAIPRPPLWDMNPTPPGTAAGGAKVAFSRTRGDVLSTPRQLGPTIRIPASRHTSSSSCWRPAPSAPVSANPDEITQQAAHAGGRALARGSHHLLGGHRHDRQLDPAGNVADRPVRRQRLHHVGLVVDRIDRAAELGREQVVQDLAADRAPPPRRADHGHRARLEEAPHRGHRPDPLAFLEPLDRRG